MRVLVLGAAGNVGRRLVGAGLRHGHDITAFVRDPSRLGGLIDKQEIRRLTIHTGDALDPESVARAIDGQDAIVCAAGSSEDPDNFRRITQNVIAQAEAAAAPPKRLWLFGGVTALDIPGTDIMAADCPGVPRVYQVHKDNYFRLKQCGLDWSFMCPGPLIDERDRGAAPGIRVSTEWAPYDAKPWMARLPKIIHTAILFRHIREMVVTYEQVAEVVMSNLEPSGVYSRRRVAVASSS